MLDCAIMYCGTVFHFRSAAPLTWQERANILRGAACGVAYLHSSTPPFIHHDIKSLVPSPWWEKILSTSSTVPYSIPFQRHNILLDGALNPVVADFGFVTTMLSSVGSMTVVTAAGAAVTKL